ncbi:uncharacterized protein LOC131311425 [Rhododendron vialii]|uniref:uncharacterized protein LOC131311425 n=1 Tax=Rhododendron vialii TaxID=182163 RepID=UPI0026601F88|nr:uncharacterized protein LOC131311425 [Rhododendron vialii]
MGSGLLRSSSKPCELDKMGTQKISVSDQTNRLQRTNFDSDSFVVDVERLSLLADKDTTTANSGLTKSLSRKVSQHKSVEKMINPSTGNDGNEKDAGVVASISSPRAGDSFTPEKPMVVTVATTKDQPMSSGVHHQITIVTGNVGTRNAGERRSWRDGKRFSFRRSSPASWAVDPRRILLFFATLSSMGTILLIYFTLSMGRQSGVDSDALN